jgi:hypothetical protein
MALAHPRSFPEAYWLDVVAAEATARAELINGLSRSSWQVAGGTRYLHWDDIKRLALSYVTTVVAAFAKQACAAARTGDLRLAELDSTIESFVDIALHHGFYGLALPKIQATWPSRHTTFEYEMRPLVMAQSWHLEYLAEVPKIYESLTKPSMALSQVSERRRAFVQPRLEKKGLTVSTWCGLAGVDPSVGYDYLSGKTNPRADNRLALAEALSVPPNELP